MKLCTAEQMRSLDAMAINRFGIPSIVLMENAGRGTVDAMVRHLGDPANQVVSIFVGPGNNGGDGLVIARHLHQLGALPRVYLLVEPEKLTGDAAVNLAIVNKLPVPVRTILNAESLAETEEQLAASWAALDAIFGTGLKREVSGHFAEAIKRINRFTCPVVAVDVPSGLDSDSGQPLGICVQADLTATFGLAKPGLVLHQPGTHFVGRLEVVDIGIPPQTVEDANIQTELLTTAEVAGWLPPRKATSHKGTFGHLLILAGSAGKTGAAILCANGALRAGTGLVSLGVPHDLNTVFAAALTEAMTVPLANSTAHLSATDFHAIEQALAGKQALAMGPGLGTAAKTVALVQRLYTGALLPMVVDADAVNALAAEPGMIASPPAPRILTPHPGEMARLTGLSTAEIQADRLRVARKFATTHRVFLVLKGAGTVIAAPDGEIAVNPTGNPGMAAGGMGDVLTGLIGGLLAQGLSPWQAACLGVYAHGLAGDRLLTDRAINFGFLAGEVAAELPRALEEIITGPSRR